MQNLKMNLEMMLLLSFPFTPTINPFFSKEKELAYNEELLQEIDMYLTLHLQSLEELEQEGILTQEERVNIEELVLLEDSEKSETIKFMNYKRVELNRLMSTERSDEEFNFYRHSGCSSIKRLYDAVDPRIQDSITRGVKEVIHAKYKVLVEK